MSLTALIYLLVIVTGSCLALVRGPKWGLLTYIFVYLVAPDPGLNWWAGDLPAFRWSLLVAGILLTSVLLHKNKLNDIRLGEMTGAKIMLAYLALSLLISMSTAVDSAGSYARCYDFFRYIVVFYLLVRILRTEEDMLSLITTLLLGGLILGYTAYVTPRYAGRLEHVGPPDGADANSLGLLFAALIPLTLPLFQQKNRLLKLFALGAFIFIANGLVLSNSRGATLSLMVGAAVLLYYMRLQSIRKKVLLCVAIMSCAFLYLTDTAFLERFQTIGESAETDRGSGRLEIWASGLEMAKDYPMGTGGNGFKTLSPVYIPPQLLTGPGLRSSHNTSLLILTEQGVAGFAIMSWFILKLLGELRTSYRTLSGMVLASEGDHSSVTFYYVFTVSLAGSLVCLLVGAQFGDRLYFEFFYIVAALAVALRWQLRQIGSLVGDDQGM